jgi:hypothetical protein
VTGVEERSMKGKTFGVCVVAASLLAGCGMFGGQTASAPTDRAMNHVEDPNNLNPNGPNNSLYSLLFGGDEAKQPNAANGAIPTAAGIGINAYMWRATLDTLSFMPIASADPFGGVVITDWYSPTATPNERFKVNVFLLGRELRPQGVHAAIFHQARQPGGQWRDAVIDPQTTTDIENSILTKARQFQLANQAK